MTAAPGLPAVLVTGAPATGKSTLARLLAGRLGAALLDQDVATGPLVEVVQRLVGTDDLDDPRLRDATRTARYEVLTALAVENLAAGVPVVLVAPYTAERADPAAWERLRAAARLALTGSRRDRPPAARPRRGAGPSQAGGPGAVPRRPRGAGGAAGRAAPRAARHAAAGRARAAARGGARHIWALAVAIDGRACAHSSCHRWQARTGRTRKEGGT
jgi:predicted kinase